MNISFPLILSLIFLSSCSNLKYDPNTLDKSFLNQMVYDGDRATAPGTLFAKREREIVHALCSKCEEINNAEFSREYSGFIRDKETIRQAMVDVLKEISTLSGNCVIFSFSAGDKPRVVERSDKPDSIHFYTSYSYCPTDKIEKMNTIKAGYVSGKISKNEAFKLIEKL